MKYNFNGKDIKIPDAEIDKYVNSLGISIDEAIELWLDDNDYTNNEEAEALTQKAKDNRILATIHEAKNDKKPRVKREVTRREDPDKENLISWIANFLQENTSVENLKVTNIGKIIEFNYGGNEYKLDLIKRRAKK